MAIITVVPIVAATEQMISAEGGGEGERLGDELGADVGERVGVGFGDGLAEGGDEGLGEGVGLGVGVGEAGTVAEGEGVPGLRTWMFICCSLVVT